ncbi:S41A family C-terminal processing peptidase-3 [Balneicella halophila]|uniref:S41A family C-terminal processing peptidase-3 n=1 Tax=Balneicella halophila TaxID=1537566 RepID=A0A7L4US14_BALHA|nr:S41 family peptidase [Balneicella halophila]PVX52211.1 S41A family C-terminal processing peptidase-3 [Balneicella halophila]
MKKIYIINLFCVFLCTSTFTHAQETDKAAFDLSKNLTIYHNILKELNLLYVDSLDNEKLINKGIESMLEELDPYTIYLNEKDMVDFKTQTTGEYGGIGTLIGKRDEHVFISQVYEGLPADKAGLKAGDKIISINGENTVGMDMQEATDIMKGRPNTSFTMTVERPYSDQKVQTFTIHREKIQLDCVPYDTLLNNNVGYLLFTNFTNKAEQRVKETVKKLKKEGATSLIIDLRGNPGGLLDQAVKVVNLFIPKNETVVATKGRISQWDRSYQTTKNALDEEIPIVILINRGSASASEIVAGTIQDLDRGVIMGTHSFGKGLVQTTREVGYNSKLKVTTSKYYIPSGRCIQALDYTHRNDDGSVGHIPDSLISAYKTRNGRTVYDGGGIMPDIKVESEDFSNLTKQLSRTYQIFDFATWYANTQPKPSSLVTVDDNLFEKFVSFVDTSDFDYESESYSMLKKLKEAVAKEKHEHAPDLSAVETLLKPKLNTDLWLYKDEIEDLIEFEINKRFFYQKGGYAQAVHTDETVEEAVELLNDGEKYKGMLDGTIPVDSSIKQKQEKDD